MNMKTKWIAVFLVGLLTACATQQQREERQARTKAAVAEMLAKRHWQIDVTQMGTLRYGSRMVTPDFFLQLRGDTLCSYLPFLGQAYQAPMASPPQGLNFEKTVQNYVESRPKANFTRMEMDVRTQEDTYHYMVEIYDNGKASISVRSMNRDPVNFEGDLRIEN